MPPIRLDEEARQLMLSYRWPGNVRELKNITERISVIEENRDITASVLVSTQSEYREISGPSQTGFRSEDIQQRTGDSISSAV